MNKQIGWIVAVLVLLPAAGAHAQTQGDVALCGKRPGCSVTKVYPAGKTAQGHPIRVVELRIPVKRTDRTMGGTCPPNARELWVVWSDGKQERSRMIMYLCNDGYGAAGVGGDEITVSNNRLVHVQNGGSAWRWDTTRTIQLVPLRELTEDTCSWHNIAPGFSTTHWSWTAFQGTHAMRPQQCKQSGKPFEDMGCVPSAATHKSLLIPRLTEPGALAGDTAPFLGSCALTIRESGKPGYTVYGKPVPDGAELRVLAVGKRDLLVTVVDKRIQTKVRGWVHQDHVELWIGPYPGIQCSDFGPALAQWGITLGDGKVHRGFGKPKADPVVVAHRATKRGGRLVVAMRIRLPKIDYFGATVVYSKSRNVRQVRLTATSPINRRDPKTLGAFYDIGAKAATCAIRDGAVTLVDGGKPEALDRR